MQHFRKYHTVAGTYRSSHDFMQEQVSQLLFIDAVRVPVTVLLPLVPIMGKAAETLKPL